MTPSARLVARLAAVLVAVLAAASLLTSAGSPSRAADGAAPTAPVAQRAGLVVTGNVVWTSNGRPIRGVTVYAYDVDGRTRFGADVTDRYGRFVIDVPAGTEEYGVYVQGSRVGYARGWVGCDKTLKYSFGAACTHGGNVGIVKVKRA